MAGKGYSALCLLSQFLTLCLIVSSVDKTFWVWPWFKPWYSRKNCFEKLIFKKSQQTHKRHEKLLSMKRVNPFPIIYHCLLYHLVMYFGRGQKYLNIAHVLQAKWLTTFTCPANTCPCHFKRVCNKKQRFHIWCNKERVLWEELLLLSRLDS